MDAQNKLRSLAQAAQFDLSCACGGGTGRSRGKNDQWIYPAAMPDGRTLPVLKVLQSGGCERNCAYCAERLGGVAQTASFSPEDLARLFSDLAGAGKVQGLFLSSAIRGSSIRTMDRMIATVELVRFKYRFSGYVHLKIIPGSEEAQIHRAMQLANRVSVNLEVPTATSLGRIAPHKNLDLELMSAIARVGSLLEEKKLRCRSQTTQFVVGASNENDREIMSALWRCYREMNLARGYFSAFQPVAGTPLADKPATSPRREHRLYQTDFLLRRYGFSFEDLFFDGDGNLPLSIDPKTIWASRHREIFPLEINNAPLKTLMRVPGIGPEAASALVNLRNREKIRTIEALKSAAPRWRIAAPYLLLDGRIAAPSPGRQLDLF